MSCRSASRWKHEEKMRRILSQISVVTLVVLITWLCIPLFAGFVMQISQTLPSAINPFPKDHMQALILGGVIGFLVGAIGTSIWVIRIFRTRNQKMEAKASNHNFDPTTHSARCAL